MNTTEYQLRAQQTRSRRQAKGCYAKPTQFQKDAYRKMITQGYKAMTAQDWAQMATHPHMTHSQRREYLALAQGSI